MATKRGKRGKTLSGFVPADEISKHCGLGARQLRDIAKAGYFPHAKHGQYNQIPTLEGVCRYQRELLTKKSGKRELELESLATVKRKAAEFEFEQMRGLYVLKSEIGPALRNLSLHQRAKLQFKLENEVAPSLVGLHPLEIRAKLAQAVDEICTLFREGTRAWMDSPPPAT